VIVFKSKEMKKSFLTYLYSRPALDSSGIVILEKLTKKGFPKVRLAVWETLETLFFVAF